MAREDSPHRTGRDGKPGRARDGRARSPNEPVRRELFPDKSSEKKQNLTGFRIKGLYSRIQSGSIHQANFHSEPSRQKAHANGHHEQSDYRNDPHRLNAGSNRYYDERRDRDKDRRRAARDRSRSRDRGRHQTDRRKHSPSRYGRLSRSRSPPARRLDKSRSRSPRRRDDRYSRRSPRRSPRPRSPRPRSSRERDGKKKDSRPSTRDSRDKRQQTQEDLPDSPARSSKETRDSPALEKEYHLMTQEERVKHAEQRKKALRENLTRHLTEDRPKQPNESDSLQESGATKQSKATPLSKKRKILGDDIGVIPTQKHGPSPGFKPLVQNEAKDPDPAAGKSESIKLPKLAMKAEEDDKPSSGVFGEAEDEVKKPKFRKLEDEAMPPQIQLEAAAGEDEDTVFDDLDGDGTESKYDARRGYAEKAAQDAAARAERVNGTDKSESMDVDPAEEDEDNEIDPLDAYMRDLSSKPNPPAIGLGAKRKASSGEQKASFELEEDDGMTAVDTEDVIAATQAKIAKNSNKKKLPVIDHSKINYITFKKDFYREPEELKQLDETDVARLRIQLDKIDVGGRDPPKPVLRWSHFGFSSAMLNVLDNERKFKQPTPIQAQGIPTILSGRDVIGIAKTGSGKTLAYLLPMFRHVLDQPPLNDRDGPIGFILVPTRELAIQVYNECKIWCRVTGLKCVAAYGGHPISEQINSIKTRPQIVIATPGRWIEILTANSSKLVNHRRTTYVVLDEADRLFDGGFQPQVLKIMEQIRPDRQLVIFSATFPKIIEGAALKYLRLPVRITVSGIGVVAPEITQVVEVHEDAMKMRELLRLFGQVELDEENKALVFVERQEACDEAVRTLRSRGYLAISVHGGKEQIDRQDAIRDFMNGTFLVLVATSVAARGLDVRDLKLVVNFDPPNHLEDYVHRAGRTGRAGNTGTAVTFISPEEGRFAASIITALEASGQEVPGPLRKLYDQHQEHIKSGKAKKEQLKVYDGFNEGNKGLGALDYRHRQAQREEQKHWRKEFKEIGGDEIPDEPEEAPEEKPKKPVLDDKPAKAKESDEPMDYLQQLMHKVDQADMTVRKTERPTEAQPKLSAKERAEQAGGAINARLRQGGSIRGTAPIDNKGPDAGAFHATLEINDFPQKARWSVTNRSNVAKILESSGASITNKGNFYAPGAARPGPTEAPPLYILVEGDTELQVKEAMNDLKELLKAGIQADAAADARNTASTGAPSRYKVT